MRESSFRRLVTSHLDLLYGAAVRMTGRPDRAEDLVQETCRIAFERWTTLRDPAACRAWLLRILRNSHIDELRRTRRLVPIGTVRSRLARLRMRLIAGLGESEPQQLRTLAGGRDDD